MRACAERRAWRAAARRWREKNGVATRLVRKRRGGVAKVGESSRLSRARQPIIVASSRNNVLPRYAIIKQRIIALGVYRRQNVTDSAGIYGGKSRAWRNRIWARRRLGVSLPSPLKRYLMPSGVTSSRNISCRHGRMRGGIAVNSISNLITAAIINIDTRAQAKIAAV